MVDPVEMRLRWAWWWPLYRNTLIFLCLSLGVEPDAERLHAIARRAATIEIRIFGGRWVVVGWEDG